MQTSSKLFEVLMSGVMESNRVSLIKFRGGPFMRPYLKASHSSTSKAADKTVLVKPKLCAETDVTGAAISSFHFVKALIDAIFEMLISTRFCGLTCA